MKNDLIFCLLRSCGKIIVVSLLVLFLISGCSGDGDGGFEASDGEYSIMDDGDQGGYLKVIDSNIYSLSLSMKNPPTDGSCMVITGASLTRPGESEPFMEFANINSADPFQRIIYFDPIGIDDDGKFTFEESIEPGLDFCGQSFKISGTFQDKENIDGTWQYTIDGESITGLWWAQLFSTDSYLEPFSIPSASIVIDGDRSDWEGVQPVVSDEEGDENPDADFSGTDLKAFYLARDDEFLYHMITLYDGDPPVGRNLVYSISFDKYPVVGGGHVPGDQGSAVFLSYPPDGDVLVDLGETALNAEGFEVSNEYSSDYAAIGNKFIEYKIPLKDMKSIDGKYTDIYVHMLENDDYPISDEMDSMARIADSGGGYNE